MLGGILADFVRNPEIAALPASVQAGVRLHRSIDGFTDRHPLVQRSITRVSSRLGWYSGIAIDIYYDHLLARSWRRFASESLPSFAGRAYRTLECLDGIVPVDAQGFLRRFIEQDYICSYASIEGITRALTRVSEKIAQRIPRRAVWLPDGIPDLLAADRELDADFQDFYPQLMAHSVQARQDEASRIPQEGEN